MMCVNLFPRHLILYLMSCAPRFSLPIYNISMFAYIKIEIFLYMGLSHQLCPNIILFTSYTCRCNLSYQYFCVFSFRCFLQFSQAEHVYLYRCFSSYIEERRMIFIIVHVVFIALSAFFPSTSMIMRFSFAIYNDFDAVFTHQNHPFIS